MLSTKKQKFKMRSIYNIESLSIVQRPKYVQTQMQIQIQIQIQIQKGVKEGVGLSILPRPDGFSQKPGENHSALHLPQISISAKDYFHFFPDGEKYSL